MIHLAAVGARYARDDKGKLHAVEVIERPVSALCGAHIPRHAVATVCLYDDERTCPFCVKIRKNERQYSAHAKPLWFDPPAAKSDPFDLSHAAE